jgi:hypothetical protein
LYLAVGHLSGQASTALAAGQSTASQVAPGVLGFLIVAALALALFFLIRSMNKQLAKVGAARRKFGPEQPPDEPPAREPLKTLPEHFHNSPEYRQKNPGQQY